MKKFIVFCIALLMLSIGAVQTNTAEAAFSKDEAIKEHFALKRERLAEVVSKKIAHVENSIKKKLKVQEAKKVQKQKEEAEKKAAVKKIEENAAKQESAQATEKENDTISDQSTAQPPQEEIQAPLAPENVEGADAVSGASTTGRERGQKNREWGEQLADPNLTPEERQGIIQEKKNYNRNNH